MTMSITHQPVSTPVARQRAERYGIDLRTVIGTGRNGVVTGGDVYSTASMRGLIPPPQSRTSNSGAAAQTPSRTERLEQLASAVGQRSRVRNGCVQVVSSSEHDWGRSAQALLAMTNQENGATR